MATLILAGDIPKPEVRWPGSGGLIRRQLLEFDALPREIKTGVGRWLHKNCEGSSLLVCTVSDINKDGLRQCRALGFGRALVRAVENARVRKPNFLLQPDKTTLYVAGPDPVDAKYAGSARQLVFRERADRPWTLDAAYAMARAYRDQLMREMARDYPEYAFSANYGYTAGRHREALEVVGPTPHHRTHVRTLRELEIAR